MPSLALGTGAGAGQGIDKILERLITEQKLAQQQQSIDNEQSYRTANLKQQGEYHDLLERDRQDRAKMQSENQARDDRARMTTQAGVLANTIPKGKFLRATDPSVGMMQEGGFGSLLNPQEPVDPLGAMTEGPLQVDETREGGRPRGFLKDASAAQEAQDAVQRDKEADNARAAAKDAAEQAYRDANLDETKRFHTGSLAAENARIQAGKDKAAGAGGSATEYEDEKYTRNVESVGSLKKKVSRWTTGYGSLLSNIPETDAANFQSELDTLKANVGFGELAAMRAASKTGGALGQVSDRELTLLSSSLGALNTKQSPENFKEQLDKIESSLKRWHAAKAKAGGGAPKANPAAGAPKNDDPLGIRR